MPSKFFGILSDEQLDAFKAATLSILEKIGVRFEDEAVRNEFAKNGCPVKGDRVYITDQMVEAVCGAAQRKVHLGRGSRRLTLQQGTPHTHPTGGAPWIIDSDGTRRTANQADLIRMIRLMNSLDNIDLPGTLVYPADIPGAASEYLLTELLYRYCKKPILTTSLSVASNAPYAVELYKLFSEGEEYYTGIASVACESPLFLPKKITDILRAITAAGMPVLLLSAPMGGLTAPVTVTGCVAQCYAELLACAAYAWLVRPETPMIMGPRTFFANMKNAHTILGLPETGISSSICCQLAERDGFTTDFYGFACTSLSCDIQAGYEKMFNGMLPALSGSALITGFGSLASLMCGSLEQLVIDCEQFAMVRRCFDSYGVDNESLGLEAIRNVVFDESSFLVEDHTLEYVCGGEAYSSRVGFDRMPADTDRTESHIFEEATVRAEALIAEDTPEPLPAELERDLEKLRKSALSALLA